MKLCNLKDKCMQSRQEYHRHHRPCCMPHDKACCMESFLSSSKDIVRRKWFILLLISCRLLSSVNSSNVRCYSSTDGEMENLGFCTTHLYCHNNLGTFVFPNEAKCKNGEKCCVPYRRGRYSGAASTSF